MSDHDFGIDVLIGFSGNIEETYFYIPCDATKKVTPKAHECVAGTSVNVARGLHANGHSVRPMITIGDDPPWSTHLTSTIERWGIDLRPLFWRKGTSRTSIHIVIGMDGVGPEERMTICPYKPEYIQEKVEQELHVISEEIRLCRPRIRVATGVRVADARIIREFFLVNGVPSMRVLNPGTDLLKDAEHLRELLELTDFLVLNREEFGIFQRTLEVFAFGDVHRFGPSQVLVTHDVRGSVLWTKEAGLHRQPSFRVEALDPTGAGDCFLAYYLSAVLEGRDTPHALRFAAAAAAIQATMPGGSALPDRERIEELLQNGNLNHKEHEELDLVSSATAR